MDGWNTKGWPRTRDGLFIAVVMILLMSVLGFIRSDHADLKSSLTKICIRLSHTEAERQDCVE